MIRHIRNAVQRIIERYTYSTVRYTFYKHAPSSAFIYKTAARAPPGARVFLSQTAVAQASSPSEIASSMCVSVLYRVPVNSPWKRGPHRTRQCVPMPTLSGGKLSISDACETKSTVALAANRTWPTRHHRQIEHGSECPPAGQLARRRALH